MNDAAKDYGDPKTNFMLPVTTSGPSYELFQGLTSLNDAAKGSNLFRYVEPFALLAKAENIGAPEVVPLRRLLKFEALQSNKSNADKTHQRSVAESNGQMPWKSNTMRLKNHISH